MPCAHSISRQLGSLGAHVAFADRKPFAQPGARPQYNPDRPCRVEHLKLEVAVDFKARSVKGACTLTIRAVADGVASVPLDAIALEIASVKSGSRRLRWEPLAEGLQVFFGRPLKAGQTIDVTVAYRVTEPKLGLYFVAPEPGYPDKPVQVWSQGQDNDSRNWFPCHDAPNAKATTEVVATVPEAMFALSNGRLLRVTRNRRAGTRTFHWRESVPHATYLVTLAAGRFTEMKARAGKVPVTYYVQPGREADGRRAFGKTPAMIRFFEKRLGVPYPYEKYAQVAVADFVFGGMENTSATTQTDLTLHDARAHLDFSSDPLVAHELAHQWFGDLLTCKDWSHAWLNEGFATYMEACWTQHDLGEDEFRYEMLENARAYLSEDGGAYRRPIVTHVYAEPIDLFDRHLYQKGSWVLHMLRGLLGEESFWASITRYLQDNLRGSVETVDLQRAIEKTTGRNLQPFFDQWIHKGGHPDLKASYAWNPEKREASVTVTQVQDPADGTSVFTLPLTLAFRVGRRTETRTVTLSEKERTFVLPLPGRPRWVRLDPRGTLLKTLDFPRPYDMLAAQLAEDPDCLGRIEAAQGLAKLGTPEAFKTLAKALFRERFWGVQAEIARVLGTTKSARALDILRKAAVLKHPKARRAAAEALGEFRDPAAAKALRTLLARDASYFVEASAARALGRTRDPGALQALEAALAKPSHVDVIRSSALAGLAEIEDERAFALLMRWTRRGMPEMARLGAIRALGAIAEGRPAWQRAAVECLAALLEEPSFRLRMAVLGALGALKDERCLPAVARLMEADVDGRIKRQARTLVGALREGKTGVEATRKLREDLDAVSLEQRRLKERLDRMAEARG